MCLCRSGSISFARIGYGSDRRSSCPGTFRERADRCHTRRAFCADRRRIPGRWPCPRSRRPPVRTATRSSSVGNLTQQFNRDGLEELCNVCKPWNVCKRIETCERKRLFEPTNSIANGRTAFILCLLAGYCDSHLESDKNAIIGIREIASAIRSIGQMYQHVRLDPNV